MANNPNDTNPSPFPPDDASGKRPAKKKHDQDTSEELPNLDDLDLAALPDDAMLTEPEDMLPAVGSGLPEVPGEELTVPDAIPASDPGLSSTHVGDHGPVTPIAPVGDWIDDGPTEVDVDPLPKAAPLNIERADPDGYGESPSPAIESSDIFSNPPLPMGERAESSDVIAATSYGEASSSDAGASKSDVVQSMGKPGGSSGNLPIADEMSDDNLPRTATPYDSGELIEMPDLPSDPSSIHAPLRGESPDFGASPRFDPDASSILADLSDPDASVPGDSSAVPLAKPGGGRSYPSDPSAGSGFDLTVGGNIPPELTEAEAESKPPSSGLLSNPRTSSAELNLDFVASDTGSAEVQALGSPPAEDAPFAASPSSIFSDENLPMAGSGVSDSGRVLLGASPPKDETGSDSSVEFSDSPEAEDEAAASRIFGPANPSSRVTTPSKSPVSDFEPSSPGAARTNLPDDGVIDWDLSGEPDDSTVGMPRAKSSLSSGRLSPSEPAPEKAKEPTLPDGRSPVPHGGETGKPAKSPSRAETGTSSPSVEIDWMTNSSGDVDMPGVASDEATEPTSSVSEWDPEAPTRETKVPPRTKGRSKEVDETRPVKAEKSKPEREPRAAGKGGWIGGTLLGMVIAGGGFAGAYFGGLLPNGDNTTKPSGQPTAQNQNPNAGGGNTNPGTGTGAGTAAPTAADVAAAVRSGNAAKAKELAASIKDETSTGKAAAGEAQLFALVQEQKADGPIAADNADLKAARENLQTLVDDAEAAKTPEGERAAVKAAVQLGISHELAGDTAAARKVYQDAVTKFPNFATTFQAALDRLAVTAPARPMPDGSSRRLTPADAHQLLLAVTLLQADGKADDTEAGVFFWKAVNKAAADSYTEAVEEIKKAKAAHVKQAKANAGRGLNPLSDPLEQIFPRCCDDLKAYWELRGAIYSQKPIAELVKKDGATKAMAELAGSQKKAAEAVTLMTNLKDATDKLTVANDKLTVAMKDVADAKKAIKDETEKFDKRKLEFVKAEAESRKELENAITQLGSLEREKKKLQLQVTAILDSVAEPLMKAKLLPPKHEEKDVFAAVKAAAEQATGPNLASLLPKGMIAVGGGLSAGQLVSIADRMTKAEAAAKTAREKYDADLKRHTDSHVASLKQMTDSYNENVKNIMATNAANVKRLKDDQATALKKASDKYVADAKKLTDDFQGKVKDAELVAAKEKERAEAITAQFKKDLGNALSPAQALDLWLPVLVELRRPSDAAPALVSAETVIASAPIDSEDAGKAHTVAGLARLFKGDLPAAKLHFEGATGNPQYGPALKAKKLWATAAEVGKESVRDPLAPYRQPVESPKRDAALAARHLDAGVKAYRDGRYEDALASLTDSTKADPTNPVAWYFLGATRWATDLFDEAKDDFRQGAVREAASTMTTRAISEAISPIQGEVRDVLTAARP